MLCTGVFVVSHDCKISNAKSYIYIICVHNLSPTCFAYNGVLGIDCIGVFNGVDLSVDKLGVDLIGVFTGLSDDILGVNGTRSDFFSISICLNLSIDSFLFFNSIVSFSISHDD